MPRRHRRGAVARVAGERLTGERPFPTRSPRQASLVLRFSNTLTVRFATRQPSCAARGSAERSVEREMGVAAKRRLRHSCGTGSERARVRERWSTSPPVSGVPFQKRPSTDPSFAPRIGRRTAYRIQGESPSESLAKEGERVDAPRPARLPTEAYPRRYGERGQRRRGGCSGPRMPASSGNGAPEAGEPLAPGALADMYPQL
jgi:hypothetical protein